MNFYGEEISFLNFLSPTVVNYISIFYTQPRQKMLELIFCSTFKVSLLVILLVIQQ